MVISRTLFVSKTMPEEVCHLYENSASSTEIQGEFRKCDRFQTSRLQCASHHSETDMRVYEVHSMNSIVKFIRRRGFSLGPV